MSFKIGDIVEWSGYTVPYRIVNTPDTARCDWHGCENPQECYQVLPARKNPRGYTSSCAMSAQASKLRPYVEIPD
jgi:hypothetical protein